MGLYTGFVGMHNNIKLVCKIVFLVATLSYFTFHAISGENGFISYISIKQKVKEKSSKLDLQKSERDYLQKRVELLGNKSLDLDLLEERCRIVLSYCYEDEIIIREKSIR